MKKKQEWKVILQIIWLRFKKGHILRSCAKTIDDTFII